MNNKETILEKAVIDRWSRRFLFAALSFVTLLYMLAFIIDGVELIFDDKQVYGWVKIFIGTGGVLISLLFGLIARNSKESWFLDASQ